MPINTFTTLDDPSATFTQAFGINGLGQIVGRFNDASGQHGFLCLSSRGGIVDRGEGAVAVTEEGVEAHGVEIVSDDVACIVDAERARIAEIDS
jgi:hypothetical protein